MRDRRRRLDPPLCNIFLHYSFIPPLVFSFVGRRTRIVRREDTKSTGMQTVEKLPVTHALNQILIKAAKGKKKNSVTKGLSGWAKAQMMMLYALEHDSKWVHNGFLQVAIQANSPLFGHLL